MPEIRANPHQRRREVKPSVPPGGFPPAVAGGKPAAMSRRQPAGAETAPALITDTAALAALCERLRQERFVTVDTEFMRERTYWPELCVVQLAGDNEVAVLDALAPGLDLGPLGALLADDQVVKVFHAARQDVEIFLLKFGAVPTPL